jgi:subtilase family serine protease
LKNSRLVAAVSATAIALLSTGTSALAATSAPTAPSAPAAATAKAAPSTPAPDYRRSCALPKPGQVACMSLVRTDIISRASLSATLGPGARNFAYTPEDLRHAYKIAGPSRNRGKHETVAIVDAHDDPDALADLTAYRHHFRLPACTRAHNCFRKVNVNGKKGPLPTPNTGWGEEISLDLDMVSAICPNCHILLIEAKETLGSLGHGVNRAVKMGAKFVSNSYGGPEFRQIKAFDKKFYRHPGVAVTASAGDNGFGVNYPAASRYVTAVGGTSLKHASNKRGWSEKVWGPVAQANGATGSGCSRFEAKPRWQKDRGCRKRTVADVSAVADPNTGLAVYDTFGPVDNGFVVIGGTSAASPIIASIFALVGRPRAHTYPSSYLYKHKKHLFDVTSGRNGSCHRAYLCHGKKGFDGPTGLGTPHGVAAFRP